MGLFGFLDKKQCAICGNEIGLLGNTKLADGNLCKECAAKLSPWFHAHGSATADSIAEQLDYREANREAVEAFHTTRSYGTGNVRLLIDEDAGRFMVTGASDIYSANPDVLDCSEVTACDLEVTDGRSEIYDKDPEGHRVSFDPKRYKYDYDFYMNISVNHPYFNRLRFKINRDSVHMEDMVTPMENRMAGMPMGGMQQTPPPPGPAGAGPNVIGSNHAAGAGRPVPPVHHQAAGAGKPVPPVHQAAGAGKPVPPVHQTAGARPNVIGSNHAAPAGKPIPGAKPGPMGAPAKPGVRPAAAGAGKPVPPVHQPAGAGKPVPPVHQAAGARPAAGAGKPVPPVHQAPGQRPGQPGGQMTPPPQPMILVSVTRPDPTADPDYISYQQQGEEIREALMYARQAAREQIAEEEAPRMAVICQCCGASTIPDLNGCCEYCGGPVNG